MNSLGLQPSHVEWLGILLISKMKNNFAQSLHRINRSCSTDLLQITPIALREQKERRGWQRTPADRQVIHLFRTWNSIVLTWDLTWDLNALTWDFYQNFIAKSWDSLVTLLQQNDVPLINRQQWYVSFLSRLHRPQKTHFLWWLMTHHGIRADRESIRIH